MSGDNQTTSQDSGPAPKVSVIIPVYNRAAFVVEALESIFRQTFRDFEVILVNDGSADTPQLETALIPYLSRLHYIKQENRGASAARNTAIRKAQGELLAFLDSDDSWLPGYLDAQVKFLDQNPQVVASVADAVRFGELAGQSSVRKMLKADAANTLTFEQMLRREGDQLPSAMVARRLRSIQAGLYDESLFAAGDIEFVYRLLFPDGLMGYLHQALVKYRRHAASISGNFDDLTIIRNEAKILRLVGKKLPLTALHRAMLNKEVAALDAEGAMIEAHQHLSNQEFRQASACFRQANAYYQNPKIKLTLAALKVFPRLSARALTWHWSRRRIRARPG